MREKTVEQAYLDFSRKSTVKVVQEYRKKYEAISEVLEANPQILNLAHKDFSSGLSESEGGRKGYTSEQILRALIVMFIEGDSYRDVVVRIENSEFFQRFVRRKIKSSKFRGDSSSIIEKSCVFSSSILSNLKSSWLKIPL